MKIIGLTGGIASGKSTVSSILNQQGAHIIDADQIAREIVAPGTEALAEIAGAFGECVLAPDGTLKRGELSRMVFNDEKSLLQLNRITHPRIVAAIKERIMQETGRVEVVVLDAALLIELSLGFLVDETWLVWVEPDIQINRLIQRESMSRADAEKIIRSQLPLDVKMKAADVCIDNNGTFASLQDQIIKLWNEQVKK